MKHQKTVAEFFAGIGLMRMGLEQAGWQTLYANDIDEKKWEMYRDHFGDDGTFHLGDVHKVESTSIPKVDLATASFPCNDLSLAGARKGLAGEQSSAFWGFIQAITAMGSRRPSLVLLENVTGFLTSHDGNDFRDALAALNTLDYAVDAFIVDALRFVPQSRQRLFVIGTKGQARLVKETTPKFLESDCRPSALADFILWHPDIAWRIRQLPPLPSPSAKLEDVIESLSPNSAFWWSRDRVEYLLNQMSPRHRGQADVMIRSERTRYATVFRRVRYGKSMAELRTDGVAGCLRTPRGGSGRQILFVAGRGRCAVRLLTPRECARLMGAGDFTIKAPVNQALFGFGDAVCVPVIKWIAENYLNPIWKELYAEEEIPKAVRERHVVYRKAGGAKADRVGLPEDVAAIRREIASFFDTKDAAGHKIGNYQYGVYAFYDYDGEPIYIGQTFESLRQRIGRHLTNQRTDAVAMNVLDPFEVAEICVWPLDLSKVPELEKRAYLDCAEYTLFQRVISESKLGAVLNEKPPARSKTIQLPPCHRRRIIPDSIYPQRKHPDVRIARRASTIASLARVISERDVSSGLRRTLLTQARRLERLAAERLEDFPGESNL